MDWTSLEQEMIEIAHSCFRLGILIGVGIGIFIGVTIAIIIHDNMQGR